MTPEEFARVRGADRRDRSARPRRRSRRLRPHRAADLLDLRRLARPRSRPAAIRSSARSARANDVPRKLVVLCDVSGSMEAYARALLLFVHAVVGLGRGVEAFAFGTRLTRLTRGASGLATPRRRSRRRHGEPSTGRAGTRIGASLKDVQRRLGPARAHCAARSS